MTPETKERYALAMEQFINELNSKISFNIESYAKENEIPMDYAEESLIGDFLSYLDDGVIIISEFMSFAIAEVSFNFMHKNNSFYKFSKHKKVDSLASTKEDKILNNLFIESMKPFNSTEKYNETIR